jgi:hypothetical protein
MTLVALRSQLSLQDQGPARGARRPLPCLTCQLSSQDGGEISRRASWSRIAEVTRHAIGDESVGRAF